MSRTSKLPSHSQPFVFVYGNHGESPVQIEDYYELLADLVHAATGRELVINREPMSGHLNFLLEAFDQPFVESLRNAKASDPSTKFICVATEFRTGPTFNNFSRENVARARPVFKGKFLLSQEQRDAFRKKAPYLFHPARLVYRALLKKPPQKPDTTPSHYSSRDYWLDRFGWFKNALAFIDQVWVVCDQQVEGYRSLVDEEKFWLLPIIPFSEKPSKATAIENAQSNLEQDIDVLFTGTMTTHRKAVLDAVRASGLEVTTAPFTLPSFVRNSLVKRAKVCLHLKQSSDWQYTSVMRLHHLLMNAKYVVSEGAQDAPIQEQFVEKASAEEIPQILKRRCQQTDIHEAGEKAKQRYIAATALTRAQALSDFRKQVSRLIAPQAQRPQGHLSPEQVPRP